VQSQPHVFPTIPAPTPTPSAQPAKEKTLDQLLDELTSLRAQKAEMEKKEQDLIKVIQQKALKQNERMRQLGLPPAATGSSPDRVGRIKIEGNTITTDGTICELLNLPPGQVFDNTKLKEARERLERAGFESVIVEFISSDLDSGYKDILVRVKEKKP
jgi:outer membrane protein assembly factor BamA